MSADDEFNPYSRPLNSDGAEFVTGTRSPGPLAILFVVMASIVAAGAAFFCTCMADVVGPGRGGVGILLCGLCMLLAYMFTAKFALSIIGRMSSSSQAAPVRNASWPVLFLSACVVAAVFFYCVLVANEFWGILGAACAAIVAGTVVIWKLPQLKRAPDDASVRPDGTTDVPQDTSASIGDETYGR
ncbi:MAG: hypothetical protein GY758_03745 [Fuerstiella sp.]|nr:hypothetical protein [Fuerstiella sp.]MCP4512881.1 hypothetical protein [Fuerstiella sp.]